MALPSDVQDAVDAAIAKAHEMVDDAVDALTSGGNTMLAAAAALQGQAVEHPALNEVLMDVNTANTEVSDKLGAAVANFRAQTKVLADAIPAAPAA